jgi:hypothetical protein
MRSLWFKQCYVADILNGTKSNTYRVKRPRFVEGETISASVGPIRPFVILRVDELAELSVNELSSEKHSELSALYDLTDVAVLYRISFSILDIPKT